MAEATIVQERKKIFKDMLRGGMETQTSSVADEYLRDAVCEAIWNRNTVTFPDVNQWHSQHKWLTAPDPHVHIRIRICIYIYIQISYMHIYVYIFTHVNFLTKSKRMEKKQAVTQTCRSQVTVSGEGFQTKHRSGQVSGQGFQKQRRSGQVSGQGVPET